MTNLRDNITLILSFAQQHINMYQRDFDSEIVEAQMLQDTLNFVRDALGDIQTDNYGQFVIYTGVQDDSKPEGYYDV